MLAQYLKRKYKRIAIKILIILSILYPITFAAFSMTMLHLNFYFSPLNIISIDFKAHPLGIIPYLGSLGYFSSTWNVTVHESPLIKDGISKIDYEMTLYHGPLISKKAFDEPLPFWKRLRPIVMKFEPKSDESKNESHYRLFLTYNWLGKISTHFITPLWTSFTTQNIFSLQNYTKVVINTDPLQKYYLDGNTTLSFYEKWNLLGKKDFSMQVDIKNFEIPSLKSPVTSSHLKFHHDAGEPYSDLTFACEGLVDGSVINLQGSLYQLNSKILSQFYVFKIDDVLKTFLDNSFTETITSKSIFYQLTTLISDSYPQHGTLIWTLVDSASQDMISVNFDHNLNYRLESQAMNPLSLQFLDNLQEVIPANQLVATEYQD